MIYNIHGFQHAKLLEFGLDNDDALILRAITGMYASPKMEHTTIDGVRYIWVNQSYLQRQVKIVGSKRTIMRRVNKMIEKGILSSHTLYSKKGVKGTYYYIAPTENLDRLRDIEPYDNMSKGQALPYDKVSKGGMTKCPTKDTINNIDTNNNTNNNSASNDAHLIFFEKVWKRYPNKRNKGRVSNSKKKEIYKLGDEFLRAMSRYIKDVENQRQNGFKSLRYKVGSTFFNSGYIDYLDENYKETMQIDNNNHKQEKGESIYDRFKRY